MLSLSNSYSEEDLLDFDRRVQEGLGIQGDLFSAPAVNYVCELKFDGISIGITYKNGKLHQAITRGDGVQGDNIALGRRADKPREDRNDVLIQ